MQNKFTLEIMVDYSDGDKSVTMKQAMILAARHVYATAILLSDGVKPMIALVGDDFFAGHEIIDIHGEDVIAKGIAQIGEADASDAISDELSKALRNIQEPQ